MNKDLKKENQHMGFLKKSCIKSNLKVLRIVNENSPISYPNTTG